MGACATIHVAWPSYPCSLNAGDELAGSCKRRTQPVSNLPQAIGQVEEIAVETKTRYWMLDCILAITAIALGTAALCSFVGAAVPAHSALVSSIEVLVCVAALVVGALFAGFVWRDQRQPGRRHAMRAHQERHAMMMRRASQVLPAFGVAEPTPAASADTKG